MFTGIITAIGTITQVQDLGPSAQHGKRLHIRAPQGYLHDVALGHSIALSGACMSVTVIESSSSTFAVDVSQESLSKTTGLDQVGSRVNLEKALGAQERFGGHMVSGHVDDVARVHDFAQVGESRELRLLCPRRLAQYLAAKGSVAVNGVSLTTNTVQDLDEGCQISINLIALTLECTTLGELQVGALVNLEVDTLARYVQRMLLLKEQGPPQRESREDKGPQGGGTKNRDAGKAPGLA